MSNSVDYKIAKITDYLYRQKSKLAKNVTVSGRKRTFQFELTLSNSDYTTVTVNSNRSYILSMPKSFMLPEDENLSYIRDMPFSEKMAFTECWSGELKKRLTHNIVREGNLGLKFDE